MYSLPRPEKNLREAMMLTGLKQLTVRNCKLYFKDKAVFFSSLITPIILLVLYGTFLSDIFHDSLTAMLGGFTNVPERVISGAVACQLFSALLAISSITVSFCGNMIMVNDKVTGARRDLTVTPVKRSTLALSYYLSTLASTLIICFAATAICLVYIGIKGFYMSVSDILLCLLDILLLTLFGTAFSSVVNFFLSSQGQISAVGTIVSAGYGFICGAYMPISQFGSGLQKVLSFLPGTYGTSLLRNHALKGAIGEIKKSGLPDVGIKALEDMLDCNLYFFGKQVPVSAMYGVLIGGTALLMGIYVLLNILKKRIS